MNELTAADVETVEVMRGKHTSAGEPELFGPLPGLRVGDVVAYEFELPTRFEPWPGRTRLERVFVLLDLGISMSNPCWRRDVGSDVPVVIPDTDEHSWYVDLISVGRADGSAERPSGRRYVFRDLFVDLIVPTDGRHYRMLDLDELADALDHGTVSVAEIVSGLRRWQRFLDRHLHSDRYPGATWTDFPPAAIARLAQLPAPFAPQERWDG